MFPWPSPAKTQLSPQETTCLLGYSQAHMDHHFVMAVRFSKTLKNKARVAAQRLLPGPFGLPSLMTLFFLPAILFFFLALYIVQGSDVSQGNQQFLRLVFCLAVFCIGPFLCIKNFSVLYTEFFHLRQLLSLLPQRRPWQLCES